MATIKKVSKAKNLSAGPSKKTPVAGPVDPRGQYTKVQKRTLGSMKTGGKVKKAQKGTYITTKSGRVGRTNGIYGPYESMDTTGYSKGKKEFDLDSSLPGFKKTSTKIKREDVPEKIKEFKKGATRQSKMKSGGKVKKK